MKKVLFILMLMTIGLSAQAAELMVGGVSVNLNQQVSDCTDGLTGGTYSYFPSQSKLVLNSAKIKTTGTYGIYSTVDGLTILINGENSIEAKIGFCLTGTTYMTINSGGKVTDSSTSYSLYANNSTKQPKIEIDRGTWILNNTITFGGDLIIEGGANVTVNNTSETITLYGDINSGSSQLTIDNSTLNVKGNSNSTAVYAPVVLKDCVIASPVRAVRAKAVSSGIYTPVYSDSDPAYIFDTSCNLLKGNLTIKPGTSYGLWICGVQVNSLNYGNIWQLETMGNMTGVANLSYNPSSKTLSLLSTSQLVSQYMMFPPIHNEISGLTINAYGTVIIGYKDNNGTIGISSSANCTIGGDGNLIVSGGEGGYAINANNSNITINNIVLTASGAYGLNGKGNSKIYVNNSILQISGSERAIYVENNGFDPDDNCFIVSPTDGFKYYDGVYTRDASTGILNPATSVQTRQLTKYSLWINDKQITEINCDRIKSLMGMSDADGSITFYPPNSLVINGLKIYPTQTLNGNYFIRTTLGELILNLTDISFMRASGKSLTTTGNVTVNGTGLINIDTGDDGMQIGGTLKITGSASFHGAGNTYGIAARKLVMTPGTELEVIARSESGRSLYCDSEPELDGVALPADMYYSIGTRSVCYKSNNQPVTKKYVKINADNVPKVATSIEEPDAFETDAPTRVYTTTGQLVWQGNGQPQLPSGIYIVNGKKAVIK